MDIPNEISGYRDINDAVSESLLNGEKLHYGENPTDLDAASDEIPLFDAKNNIWKMGSGLFYECITMKSSGYQITEIQEQ